MAVDVVLVCLNCAVIGCKLEDRSSNIGIVPLCFVQYRLTRGPRPASLEKRTWGKAART
jgi:hypothetical protein